MSIAREIQADKAARRPLIVRRVDTGEEVSRVETTPNRYEKVMMGMLRQMGDGYFIDDSAFD